MDSGLRRVVTGHDKSGKAIVEIDEISTNAISRRPGQSATHSAKGSRSCRAAEAAREVMPRLVPRRRRA